MYLRILKKDLKRKKTMNVILLVFIMLAATFIASSVNNIVTVTTALDNFYEKAEGPDYFVATRGIENNEPISQALDGISQVEDCQTEDVIYAESGAFCKGGKKLDLKNTSVIMSFSDAAIKFFDAENNIIDEVKEGTVILSGKAMKNAGINEGDVIDITVGEKTISVKVAGRCKDVILGSDLMGMTRFILNEKDFEQLGQSGNGFEGRLWYIKTGDVAQVEEVLSKADGILFNGDEAMMKKTYVMDMVIAGVLLVVSVCLILVAFVVLKFTITFTLSEEFREIGVMKAIGIGNTKIRGLYMVKYLMMAATGAVVGFFASIPFGNMLIDSVSESIVLDNENTVLINLLCCILVVAVILLFCYGCTGKIKKFTPIDAVRNGTTGERFNKKSVLSLKNLPARPSVFMALNDILSSPVRYISIMITYILCMLLVLVLVNTANTLRSNKLVSAFGVVKSDLYMTCDEAEMMSYMTADGREKAENKLDEIESKLEDNGIPADCMIETIYKFNLTHNDKSYKSIGLQGMRTSADMYVYQEGTPPQNENEIAITPLVSEKLDAEIGDTVTIHHSFGDREYTVTALYQSMNNLGEGVRLHEDAQTDLGQSSGFFSFQLNFKDSPDEKTIKERAEKVKEIFDTKNVQTAGEYVESMVGVADMIDGMKMLTLSLVMIIIALVTILMERSFITKEQSEIAVMKAIGFKTATVVSWHTMRFMVIGIVSTIAAVILSTPVTSLSITPVFRMMGAAFGIEYDIKPLEVYVIYPAVVLAVTILSSMLTSLYTRRIAASQASSIE
ncbi:MAG: ABC transporter permease [Oscillospiraceae bacterium]